MSLEMELFDLGETRVLKSVMYEPAGTEVVVLTATADTRYISGVKVFVRYVNSKQFRTICASFLTTKEQYEKNRSS